MKTHVDFVLHQTSTELRDLPVAGIAATCKMAEGEPASGKGAQNWYWYTILPISTLVLEKHSSLAFNPFSS